MSHAPPKAPRQPLPDGWVEQTDPATNHVFYAETATGHTQWERPVAVEVELAPSQLMRQVSVDDTFKSGGVSMPGRPLSGVHAVVDSGSADKPARPPSGIAAAIESIGSGDGKAFTQKLDADGLRYFNELIIKPFAVQAVAFLNAYWQEVHSQADFIFHVAIEQMRMSDMMAKKQQIYQYKDGTELNFEFCLHFYEQLCKFVEDDDQISEWGSKSKYGYSQPRMCTALERKHRLKRVDCNFDGKVSFLEYLLYQYRAVASPPDFVQRQMEAEAAMAAEPDGEREIEEAMEALREVQARIDDFEEEKARLTNIMNSGSGVKALGAKNMLWQLDTGPLGEALNVALIKAEAKVRIATKKYGRAVNFEPGARPGTTGRPSVMPAEQGVPLDQQTMPRDYTAGSIWWMNKELEEKQKRYGRKK